MNEFNIIEKYFAPLSGGELRLNDDAASLDIPAGQRLVTSCDTIVEGTHFIGNEPASQIAQKALRVNLSDMAAMGATPHSYLLALTLPQDISPQWLSDFASGLAADNQRFGIYLGGGDTTSGTDKIVISITIFGFASRILTRSGAKIGDDIYLTGSVGASYLGLQHLQGQGEASDEQIERYKLPQPRLKTSLAISKLANSCIDISDGLLQDIGHICDKSSVGANIYLDKIPVTIAKTQSSKIELITAGDDYELAFTAPTSFKAEIKEISGVNITKIGEVITGNKVNLLDGNSNEIKLDKGGFQHF